ncbi:hypothetical protein SAMN05421688_2292 [Poseidonocella pacifica]|uniref:Muramidase (Phage lambda lysozyme) n=1 Tax=Poseidonocella pacifica TaxID=871651 RepID=A0A1I0XHK4_9RHOB|nr:hypothetical protein [Poseidonocella pacifica]SFB00495.1 hypothetical protein SAMN05421688_2292 [Poseidonocella pacifica]
MTVRLPILLLLILLAETASAQALFRDTYFRREAAPAPLAAPDTPIISTSGSSLFVGRAGASIFQPMKRSSPHVERLRTLIASVEAGKAGYDAVQLAARIKPPRRPSDLTIAEIYDWIRATPGQHHAIGRYQLIPKTLRRLVKTLGVDPKERFSPKVQDRFADQLLREAGFTAFQAGELDRDSFMDNLAKIWAGLPTASGGSYYEGYAGNSAGMTRAHFSRQMADIFPD